MQEAERSSELLPQANYVTPAKQGGQLGQRGKLGGSASSGGKPAKNADKRKAAMDGGRRGGSWRRECWICHSPDHLSFECPDRSDSDEDDVKGGRGRSAGCRPRWESKPRREKQSTKSSTSAKDTNSSAGRKGRDNKEASCSLVGVVEPTVSPAPEASEDFQAMAAAVQAYPVVVLLDSGCSHHLMGTKEDLEPSGNIKHVRCFNGALQDVRGRGTVALQGDAGNPLHRPTFLLGDVDGGGGPTGDSLGTKSTPDRLHVRLAHVGMDTIWSSVKHEVATGLDLKPVSSADSPCVSCVGGKLARHTFPDQGSDADDVLAIVHIDLCGPFHVTNKDGSLYFLLLKDRKTRYIWVRPIAKKSDVLREFQQWLVVAERQTKKSVLMLHSDRGGEFLGKEFTVFVDGKRIVHDLTCPYTPQQNGMAEREMRTVVELVRTMLLHMGVQHHWWHLVVRQAVWVRNCLERSALPPGTSPYQLLTGKKPNLSLARVWGCMAQFLIPEQQRGRKLKPKARWGLHLGVEGGARAGVGADAGQPADGDLDDDAPSARRGRPPDFFVPAAFTTVYDDAEEDEELLELDPDMHADPEHRWDISTMMVKEALASWKGKAVKSAMEEEIRSLIDMGT
ncbi:unnamed protein product [Closterium sp. NIES-53]